VIDLRFEVGSACIIFTQPLTAKLRTDYHLPSDTEPRKMWVPTCLGQAPADPTVAKELGRSRPPGDAAKTGTD